MRFPFYIAWRYLFSKKSHNAINIISSISVAGISVGTLALVCVMSVMNGFEDLITDMFSAFDPDLKITATKGKNFFTDTEEFERVKALANVAYFSETIEENALMYFDERQLPATIKGVDSVFVHVASIDSIITSGEFITYDGAFERCVAGAGLAARLGLNAHFIDPVRLYAPKRSGRVNTLRPENSFNQAGLFMSGVFAVKQMKYDDNYMLVSLNQARALFDYAPHQASALELKLKDKKSIARTQKEIQNILGEDYLVKDQYEQQADFFRIMQIEKWITFLLLVFILLIATFNIIGSLSMLIIDKKKDIQTLRNIGATQQTIRQIFLLEGWLISLIGAIVGVILGTVLCLIQQHYGIISMGTGFVIDAYPVEVHTLDVLLVLFTVCVLGFAAVWYPTKHVAAKNK